jgi:hypothetical protein
LSVGVCVISPRLDTSSLAPHVVMTDSPTSSTSPLCLVGVFQLPVPRVDPRALESHCLLPRPRWVSFPTSPVASELFSLSVAFWFLGAGFPVFSSVSAPSSLIALLPRFGVRTCRCALRGFDHWISLPFRSLPLAAKGSECLEGRLRRNFMHRSTSSYITRTLLISFFRSSPSPFLKSSSSVSSRG